ncbi:MAG: T9SS type A sorting domain-containing protein [Bacteroidota bacterium]
MLFVRVQDTANVWTHTFSRSILKTRLPLDPVPNVTAMEYFLDDDPGYGQANSLPVSQNQAPVVEALIPLDGINDGLHNIYVRSQDENGRWSETFVRPFLKSYVPGEMADVTQLEYFIDTDPGVGNAHPVDIPDPQGSIERAFVVNLGAQTPGEHRLFVRAVDSRGHWSIVYNELFEVSATGAVHVVQLPEGWSGISSYVIPDDASVENIFAPVQDDLVILQNFDGMYWPSAGVNTLGNWNAHAGYQVKMETAQQVTFSGSMQGNLTANLSAGWNYLPVLNACDNEVEELFSQITGNLQIVKEVAGTGVYWPQFGINTLGTISPGKAYFVLVDADVSLEFPGCSKGSLILSDATRTDQSASADQSASVRWISDIIPTPVTHTIALPASVTAGLNEGDVIRVMNDRGMVTGVMVCHAGNNVLTAFGDDPTTPAVDGMISGEPIRFEIVKPESGKAFPLQVTWAANMPHGGNFAVHGISAVESLYVTGIDEEASLKADVAIHPNPSKGRFNITTGLQDFGWEVADIHGTSLITGNDQSEAFSVDLTSYPKGIYYLKITKGGLQVVKKLVVQ